MAQAKSSAQRAIRKVASGRWVYTMSSKQWEWEQANNPRYPAWMRVGFLVRALSNCNGDEIGFEPGEMARILRLPPTRLSSAIREAKAWGWITEESSAREAAVNPYSIEPCRPSGHSEPSMRLRAVR